MSLARSDGEANNKGKTNLTKKPKQMLCLKFQKVAGCPKHSSVFSIDFEVDIGSWKVDVAETKYQQHFAETQGI